MNDGGPAFPEITSEQAEAIRAYTGSVYSEGGMSLRDYFAAKAMQGCLAAWPTEGALPTRANFAKACYEIADVMLEARSKTLANEETLDKEG